MRILAQHSILGMFARAALPSAARVSEEHLHAGRGLALVVREACGNGLVIRFSLSGKPASAEAAVGSSIFASSGGRASVPRALRLMVIILLGRRGDLVKMLCATDDGL